jgi:hypothetical protein
MESNDQERTRSLEAQLASELKALLAGMAVGSEFDVAPSSDLCYSLELFVPKVLSLDYSEWVQESLDGVFVARARKTGPTAAELAGTCILISDQTVAPLLIDLAVSSSDECIESYRVCLGEPGGGRLGISGPDCNSSEAKVLLSTVVTRLGSIAWSYRIASSES